MTDTYAAIELSQDDSDRIREHLEHIKASQAESGDLNNSVGVAAQEFNKFFADYGKPYFTGHKLQRNDTASSKTYNENLTTLDQDTNRLYSMVSSLARSTLAAYNYASVVTKEVLNQAAFSASKVLDLNILNKFTKGSVIVAGDDFVDDSKIDTSIGIQTTQAELINGPSSLSLARLSALNVADPNTTKISITPLLPAGQDGSVNVDPTPFNLERFYEGRYYAHIGEQQPEGGSLNLEYIVDPAKIPAVASTTTKDGKVIQQEQGGSQAAIDATQGIGFFAVIQPTEDQKQKIRTRMLDNNPDTYWQCEVVYKTEPLIDPFDSTSEDFEIED